MEKRALDPKVANLLNAHEALDQDEEDLIDGLENDSELDGFREKRRQQLHEEYARAQLMRRQEYGTFQELKDEKTVLDITTHAKYCIVHFYKADFRRCEIMNSHLQELASKHFDCRFLRINVENAPFLVTKLQVQVLPCVLSFVDGKSVDRIIGFEGLGRGTDKFTTKHLESRFLDAGVLLRSIVSPSVGIPSKAPDTARHVRKDELDEDDWD